MCLVWVSRVLRIFLWRYASWYDAGCVMCYGTRLVEDLGAKAGGGRSAVVIFLGSGRSCIERGEIERGRGGD